MYYSLFDHQVGRYMATGENSESKEEVKDALLSYLSADHDEDELKELAILPPDELAAMYEFEIEAHEEKRPDSLEELQRSFSNL